MPDGTGVKMSDAPVEENKRQAQRDRIVEVVLAAGARFWRDTDGKAFARVPLPSGGQARYRVGSRAFGLVIRALYGDANPRTVGVTTIPGSVSDTALQEATIQLEAIAFREAPLEPEVRVVRFAGATWIDPGQPCWRAMRVDAHGWRVMDMTDAPLVRPDGLRPLPVPTRVPRADALGALAALINSAQSERDGEGAEAAQTSAQRRLMLCVAWLLGALHPTGPFALLAVDGEQGSAKTTTCKVLRRLVDPYKGDLRAPPRNRDDLIVAAQNSRVVALDNLSYLDGDTADDLCRLATGSGLSKRAHYTNGEEYIMDAARPVLLNGIPSLLARGDLADRALVITLPPIADTERRPEDRVWQDFANAAPGILGLLLDGLALALRDMPTLVLPRLPRMADFARLACAAAPAFGWTADAMLAALEGNRTDAIEALIEADPIAVAVRSILATDQHGKPLQDAKWQGTATALLEVVNCNVPPDVQRERGYPKDAARLSARLKRLAPSLRQAGVDVELPKAGGRAGRSITIKPAAAPESYEKQRSKRSGRSGPTETDAYGNAPERSQRSEHSVTVPQRSVSIEENQYLPDEWNAGNAGNAGNAVSDAIGGDDRPDSAPAWAETL